MSSLKTKLFFTEQAKLSQLTINQLEAILANGQKTLYIDSDNILRIAEKNNNVVIQKNALGDSIQDVNISNLPTTLPSSGTAYALIAFRFKNSVALTWGWMNTIGNYNVITGSTYNVTVTNPLYQIYDKTTPGNYDFNGELLISVSGDAENELKKFSIDNGSNFTSFTTNSTQLFDGLGGFNQEIYDIVIVDITNTTIYSGAVQMEGVNYVFNQKGGSNLYQPASMTHLIYKSDDINISIQSYINVVVIESTTDLPGLYKYLIYRNSALLFESAYISDKTFQYEIEPDKDGVYSVEVKRIHGGYVELEQIEQPSLGETYEPQEFTWSKDNGTYFNNPSFTTPPFLLQNGGTLLKVDYNVNEFTELGSDKVIFAKRNNTNEIYQKTLKLVQTVQDSTPNNSIKVYATSGTINDILFKTPFFSDDFNSPSNITPSDPEWVPSQTPPNNLVDYAFTANFIGTQYSSFPNTELTIHIENINGDTLIASQAGNLVNASPVTGLDYEFVLVDFMSLLTTYQGEILRVRFTFNPDSVNVNPEDFILSNLKYIKYV